MKITFITILFLTSMCLWAQNVPQTIDYQGRLADSDGNYLNGVVIVDFLIYDATSGGTLLWSETQDVSTANGVFHVLLGSTVSFPTDLFDNADRWLELVVSSETLAPRTAIASVPYAVKAETAYTLQNMGSGSGLDADLLDGQDSSDFMPAITDNWVNTTGDTMTGNLVVNADFRATGITYDSSGDAGTSGQIFSSTATGTDWIDTAATGDITAVTAGTGLSGGGTSGDVTLNVDVPLELTGSIVDPLGVINGENTGNGMGVWGLHGSSANRGYLGSSIYGVYGTHGSSGNHGYIGSSDYGVYGQNYVNGGSGVYGKDNSSGNYGNLGSTYYGVYGMHNGSGNYGLLGSSNSGVFGYSTGMDYGGNFIGGMYGVFGMVVPTGSSTYFGVYGNVSGGSGTNYGIYSYAEFGNTNYAGYFSGNVHVTGTFTNPSDERFKENVQQFRNALSKIKLMNVHTFNFKQMAEEKKLVLPEGEQIGLIAQELEKILPELVRDIVHAYDKNEGIEEAEKDMEKIEYKGINYIGLIPVLIEAIKEQQEMIEAQQIQNEEQQRQIDELIRSAGN